MLNAPNILRLAILRKDKSTYTFEHYGELIGWNINNWKSGLPKESQILKRKLTPRSSKILQNIIYNENNSEKASLVLYYD
jgi:hypothetical protein